MLDFLRGIFIYVVAVALPPSGLILAIAKLSEGDREEGTRILAATLLGVCLYALLFL